MADQTYVRVLPSFWNDPKVRRKLARDQKHLLLYYMTSPHINLIGLYYLPFIYAAAEAELALESVEEWTFGALAPFVTYDRDTEEILVHRSARHQIGEELQPKDNRVKAVQRALGDAHSATLIAKFASLYQHWPLGPKYTALAKGLDKSLAKGLKKGVTEGLGKPLSVTDALSGTDASTELDVKKAFDKSNGARPRVSHPRKKDVGARLAPAIREHFWLGDKPPATSPGWSMGNELSVARDLMKKAQIDVDDLVGAIGVARQVLRFDGTESLTLKIFNVDGRLDRLNECLGTWRKQLGQTPARRRRGPRAITAEDLQNARR